MTWYYNVNICLFAWILEIKIHSSSNSTIPVLMKSFFKSYIHWDLAHLLTDIHIICKVILTIITAVQTLNASLIFDL